jgi:single-strand DNA-binding protein
VNETWVTVVGNVASEVVLRRVNDASVVSFRVISSERRFDPATGGWQDGDRVSARVSCWRRLGENVQSTLVKGDPVIVWGRLSVREYEAEGVRKYSTEIRATSVGPDLTRSKALVNRNSAAGEAARTAPRDEPVDVSGLTVVGESAGGPAVGPEEAGDPWGHAVRGLTELDPDGAPTTEFDPAVTAGGGAQDGELPERPALAG